MTNESKMQSVKNFFVKIGKRNLIIAGAVVLIGVAVTLNWIFFANDDNNDGYDYVGGNSMEGELDTGKNPSSGDESDPSENTSDNYFTTVQVSREIARNEAIEVLNAVIDNENANDEVKAQAIAEMAVLSLEMQQESDIEMLIISKGFEDCIAVVNGDSASIVVKCDGTLSPTQLAQINSVVYETAEIEPLNINIVGKS